MFARHRIGMELDKLLSGTEYSISKYKDALSVSQGVMSLNIDCTFTEFEDIGRLAPSRALNGILVHPSTSRSKSFRAPSSHTLLFETYANICRVIGVRCMADVGGSIIKTKGDKRENAPISVYLIGCLKQKTIYSEGVMVMAVGSSICKDGDAMAGCRCSSVNRIYGIPLRALLKERQQEEQLYHQRSPP
jgi:hypothetical protein